jgi:hypothetical protein
MVAAASRTQANGKTPIHSFFQMYFGGLEAMGQAYEPFTKNLARAQLEVMGLLSRRAQACMEIPSRLSLCRTPQDLANEQMRFWRTAYVEYSDSMGRMTEAMAALAAPALAFAQYGSEAQTVHDYLSFPEHKEPGRPAHPRERRAA